MIASPGRKPDYRQHLGPRLLQSNLPYLASIDEYSYTYLFRKHEPYSVAGVVCALTKTTLENVLQTDKLPGFGDVVSQHSGQGVQYPLLQDAMQPLWVGVVSRTAYLEKLANELRRCNLEQGLAQADFCLVSQVVQGEVRATEAQRAPRYEYFDQYGYVQGVGARVEAAAEHAATQSTLYYSHVEDALHELTA